MQKAIYSIDDDDYIQTIEKLALKKAEGLNENDPFKRKNKLMSYLQAKGFETDLILLVLKASNLN
ncbi:regulatory protein RecX [Pedobacter riviphilus]|uniref:RecX family transcriptional regulator n=1 Tax=Pedobacter riviphilus TaxID=2766984 RepID=UPI002103FB91|nr:RecX family transcriptional regulator [Pedobacter riviphilus]